VRKAVEQSGAGASVGAAAAGLTPEQAAAEVARVGDVVITLADVAAYVASQPPHMQTRYAAPEPRRRLVDAMIELELLVLEANKQGLATSPRVQFATKEALARELLDARGRDAGTMHTLDEAEVAAYYQARRAEFAQPERRRAAWIVVGTRAGAEALTTELRRVIAEAPTRAPQIFGDFAAKRSLDPLTKVIKGDLGWFDAYGHPDARRPAPAPEVVAPTFALAEVNALSDPIAVGQRWAVVQLTNRHQARQAPLEEVALDIKAKLYRDRATKAREAYIASLVQGATVTVDEAVLAKLQVPEPAPTPTGEDAKASAAPAAPGAARPKVGHPPLFKRGAGALMRPPTARAPDRLTPAARMQAEELREKIREGREREKQRGAQGADATGSQGTP
jgi:parvulin-like peptidyl-prolyl isomerase